MSVEQQVTQLGVSVNSLVDSARTIIEQGGAPAGGEPLPGAGAGVISVAQTLTVGPGQGFADIESAWASLKGLVINAPVTIQVIDGTHSIQPFTLSGQPFAHNIRILGNLADPAVCVLQLQAASDGTLHGPNFEGVRGLEFSGFRIVSSDPAALWGLRAAESANVLSAPNSIIVEGCDYGIRVLGSARYAAEGVRITGCFFGVIAIGARAELDKIDLTGINNTDSTYGVLAEEGSSIRAHEGIARTFRFAWHARNGGTISAQGSRAEAGGHAYSAYFGGHIDARDTEAGITSVALNALFSGFIAQYGGTILAEKAIADNCDVGFAAYYSSHIRCWSSGAKNCSSWGYRPYSNSVIYALASVANTTGNNPNYSAPTGNSHNFGAYVHYN